MESTRARYKTSIIELLKSQGHNVLFGMGDRGSDFIAYAMNDVFPIVVLRPHQSKRLKKIRAIAASLKLEAKDWAVFYEEPGNPCWPNIEKGY